MSRSEADRERGAVHLGAGGVEFGEGVVDHPGFIAGEQIGENVLDLDGAAALDVHHQPLAGGDGERLTAIAGVEPEFAAGEAPLKPRRPRLGGHGLAAGEEPVRAQVKPGEHPGKVPPQQFLDTETQRHRVVLRGFLHAVQQCRQRQPARVVQFVRLDFERAAPVNVHRFMLPLPCRDR